MCLQGAPVHAVLNKEPMRAWKHAIAVATAAALLDGGPGCTGGQAVPLRIGHTEASS